MAGVNKVILVGNLGKDPEVRYTTDGKPIANITLATSDTWTDKNSGQKQEKTEWHRVVFFGPLAAIVGEYLHKGSKIYLEGKLQTRKWQDQSGQDRYTTEVVVQGFGGNMQMLDSRSADGGQQNKEYLNNQGGAARQQNAAPQQNRDYGQGARSNNAPVNNQNTRTGGAQGGGGTVAAQQQFNKDQQYDGGQTTSQPFEDEFDDDIPF